MSILFKGDNNALIISINALLALEAKGALVPHGIGEMARDLLKTCVARLPAEQHKGEPVAWRYQTHPGGLWYLSSSEYNARLYENTGEGSKVEPLYTHADPGEVERLQRDARNDAIAYKAAIEKQEEIRSELATWKRRAIEAESKLRTYDPQVVELGEQAMQALLAEPKPKELVLTKCKLCDQLQADLTARDQQIDQMRVLLQHLVYDYRAAIQSGYDKITALGGDCDSISKMLADNPNYQKAMALLLPDLDSSPELAMLETAKFKSIVCYGDHISEGRELLGLGLGKTIEDAVKGVRCPGCGSSGFTGNCDKCLPY
ncbi:hypothetical protein RDI61_16035 [Pseudomonas plecoglossicida]|uniref:hypothetical protein n=1 Tax=Pseudomonas putida group TaxID=136845 RepID=UPI00240F3BF1|nr:MULTISPECIES: hypothetical protein [Pseudomonas putida group]MDQ7965545.1 hypothetical protein [Pseudomonas plecoglossicida]WFG03740.1 hypothetical protein P3X84_03680 [Pseudomonas putida]